MRPSGQSIAALLLAGVTSACAAIGAAPSKGGAVRTVGIISAVGDELTVTKAGLTGVKTRERSLPIGSWGIDDLIVGRTGALLSRRFQVRPVTYRRAAFAASESPPAFVIMNLRRDPIGETVRAEVSPQGLDIYLVITKATSTYADRSRTVAGIGIIKHQTLFASYVQLHALYMIRVIDGHDLRVIDKRSASPLDHRETVRLAGPSRVVDESFLPDGSDGSGNQKLQAAITELIEHSLPDALESLNLLDRS